jgi:polyhydroxyalkanoate synthesis regulator phasin
MLDILKKTYLVGVGLAAKTWEEVEALSKEMIQKAKMSEKEGSKFLQDMKKRYDDTQKKTGKYMEKVVKDIMKKMDVATGDDIKALKDEIRQLKKAAGGKTSKKRTTTAAKKRSASASAKKTTRRASAKKAS